VKIETKTGSATSARPSANGVIIAHLNNNIGGWGKGFVLAVNDLSAIPRKAYKECSQRHLKNIPLGETQFCEVEPNLWVANMIAQNGLDKSKVADGCLVDYNGLQKCLKTVFQRAVVLKCNIHIPAGMGSGLAGGDKKLITDMITAVATSASIFALENAAGFTPTVTLWEFTDTSAASYVGAPAPANAVVADVNQALADADYQGGRGIDISDDEV